MKQISVDLRGQFILSIFSDNNMKVDKKPQNQCNEGGKMIAWRLNSMLLKNQWVKDEIKRNLKILQDKQK